MNDRLIGRTTTDNYMSDLATFDYNIIVKMRKCLIEIVNKNVDCMSAEQNDPIIFNYMESYHSEVSFLFLSLMLVSRTATVNKYNCRK